MVESFDISSLNGNNERKELIKRKKRKVCLNYNVVKIEQVVIILSLLIIMR